MKRQQEAALPGYPAEPDGDPPTVLLLSAGETGLWVPHSTADNPRGRQAHRYIGARYLAARVARDFRVAEALRGERLTDSFDPYWLPYQLALMGSLAMAEGRYGPARRCVADLAEMERAIKKNPEMHRNH